VMTNRLELKIQRILRHLKDELHFALLGKDRLDFNQSTRKHWKDKHDTLEDIVNFIEGELDND